MNKVALLALLTMIALLASSTIVYAETKMRIVQFVPRINWSGPVLLEMPESFIEGASGVYVSNVSTCNVILPTYWRVVGKNAYIVFNPGKNLTAGTKYTYYLCYGDIIAPNEESLAECSLPGGCNINYTVTNATLTNTSITVKLDNALETSSSTITGSGEASYTKTILDSPARVYLVNVSARMTTMVPQDYTLKVSASNGKSFSASFSLEDKTIVRNDTSSFDTGYYYYDTGVYTVYDAGREIYASNATLTINVYDSDWDTYYVFVYLDGNLYAEYYEEYRITVDLSGHWFRTVAIRVYDTEQNDWVRAWGTIHVEVYNYTYTATLTANANARTPINTTISATTPFNIDASLEANYYRFKQVCGKVVFNITQFLIVIEDIKANNTWIFVGTSYANTSLNVGRNIAVSAGGSSDSASWGTGIITGVTPDAASAAITSTGAILGIIASSYPLSSENLTVQLCAYKALPGEYGFEWKKLLVFRALTNYTDYVVGGEAAPSSSSGTSAGGGVAGNGTVIVNVNAGLDPDLKLAIIILLITIPFALGLFTFYKAITTDHNIWIAMTIAFFSLSSLMAYVFGYYDQARGLLALNLLATYPIIERGMDWVIALVSGRKRRR